MHKDPIEYLKHILDECKYRGLLIIPFFQETNIMSKMQGTNFSE